MMIEMDGSSMIPVAAMAIPVVGSIALFSFLAVASWSDSRRKERESYYRNETLKKIVESPGEGAKAAIELMRERERSDAMNRRNGQKLGGLITFAVGAGLMLFLHAVNREEPVYWVGAIPLLIGVALLLYAFAMAPAE
jgi:peptidoglycan/LPS O-acetylase OafA/YrhL